MILENQEDINKRVRLFLHKEHNAFDLFIQYRHNILLSDDGTITFSLTNPWPITIPEELEDSFIDILRFWEKGSKEYACKRAKEVHKIDLLEHLKIKEQSYNHHSNNMEEVYKEIPNYENYQISNKGNIKSFSGNKEKILKPALCSSGYPSIVLCKEGKHKTFRTHKLVALVFLAHKFNNYESVVNHIDFNKLNNCVENLEVISQRDNTNRKHLKSASKYTGVSWCKRTNKWISYIKINNKQKFLGYFEDEEKASLKYNEALKNIK